VDKTDNKKAGRRKIFYFFFQKKLTCGQKCILHFTKYKIDSGFVKGCGCSQWATQIGEQKTGAKNFGRAA
jgi:hypothetical protein